MQDGDGTAYLWAHGGCFAALAAFPILVLWGTGVIHLPPDIALRL